MNKTLGTRIRKFRNDLGLTQATLAEKVGVSPITILRWENGSARPSQLAAEKLAGLGIPGITISDTNHDEIPQIKLRGQNQKTLFETSENGNGHLAQPKLEPRLIQLGKSTHEFQYAPYVDNGPSNQLPFFDWMTEIQTGEKSKPLKYYARRLSSVQSIIDPKIQTAQSQLESPKPNRAHWNANYGPHGWHRYIGRFPPHLVRALLNHFGAGSDHVVLDPFGGSGTTLVECRLLGIQAIGVEICPLSAMICRTKAKFPSRLKNLYNCVDSYIDFYEERWNKFLNSREISEISIEEILGRKGNSIEPFANIDKWMTPEALLGSSITIEFAEGLKGWQSEFVLTALSAKMRSIGNVDVDVARAEYRKTPRNGVNVVRLVGNQLRRMLKDVEKSLATHDDLVGTSKDIRVQQNDVRKVKLPENSVDFVITSPPYGVEASSYLRAHLLSYRCLQAHFGEDPYDFGDKVIGSEYVDERTETTANHAAAHSETFTQFFGELLNSDSTPKVVKRAHLMMSFFADMDRVISNLSKWVKSGGKVAFVVGNKKIGDHLIPTDAIITELFAAGGFERYESVCHKLKCNNTNSQVPWQERIIQEEFILMFTRK